MKRKVLSLLLCMITAFMLIPAEASAANCDAQHEDFVVQWYTDSKGKAGNIASHGSCASAQDSQNGTVPSVYILGGCGEQKVYYEVSDYTDWNLYWHMQDFKVVSKESGKTYYPNSASKNFAGDSKGQVLSDWQITVKFNDGLTSMYSMSADNVGMDRHNAAVSRKANWQVKYSEIYPNGLTISKNDIANEVVHALLPVQGSETGETESMCHFLYTKNKINIEKYVKDVGMVKRSYDSNPHYEFADGYPKVGAKSIMMTFVIDGRTYTVDLMASGNGLTYHNVCYAIAFGGNSKEEVPIRPKLTVKKTVDAESWTKLPKEYQDKEFSFSADCKDSKGKNHTCDLKYVKYNSSGAVVESGVLKSSGTTYGFKLKGGQYISIEVPTKAKTSMSVSEVPESPFITMVNVDGQGWTNAAGISPIELNENHTVEFKNTYSPIQVPALSVDKKVNGNDAATFETALKPTCPNTLTYTVVATQINHKAIAKNLTVTDTINTDKGITINTDSFIVKKGQTTLTKDTDYSLSATTGGYTVRLTDKQPLNYDESITITYTAAVAITAEGETVNTVKVNCGDVNAPNPDAPVYPEGSEPKDETHVVPEPVRFTLDYTVIGDAAYGVPTDSITPDPVTDIHYEGAVDPLASAPMTAWVTSDGTQTGIPGTWSFSTYWTEDSLNPDKADITDNKVEDIKEDRHVYGQWTFVPTKYHVYYETAPDVVWGKPADEVVPTDPTDYIYNDPVTVAADLTTKQGYGIHPVELCQVPGTWSFTPWDHTDFNITEDTFIKGAWSFTPDVYTLNYHVVGDDTYGIPQDSVTPDQVTGIDFGEDVDPLADQPTTVWTTSDGTQDGIPGEWTFSEYWTEDSENPDKADITDNKIENIRENKNVYGKWTFTPTKYHVIYETIPDAKWGKPVDEILPVDENDYIYNDPVTVAENLSSSSGYALEPGTGRKVKGKWEFKPWDHEDFNITEDTVIKGRWIFTPDPVPPITGDNTNVILWIGLAVLAVGGVLALIFTRKKKA